ncbi:MAG: nucleotide exchange factor GrpE, partial [Rhabdochlamydiaceae bacterium]
NNQNNENMADQELPAEATVEESFRTQIDKLEKELETERKKTGDQLNRMKYQQADIINLQRQADRMVSDARTQTKLLWIMEIISIREDLDRALKVANCENSVLVEGLKLVLSRIDGTLKSEEVETIKVELGTRFDPRIHEAVAFQEAKVGEDGCILSVVSQGYTVGGKVIKPALVEVVRRTATSPPSISQEIKVEPSKNEESPEQL